MEEIEVTRWDDGIWMVVETLTDGSQVYAIRNVLNRGSGGRTTVKYDCINLRSARKLGAALFSAVCDSEVDA